MTTSYWTDTDTTVEFNDLVATWQPGRVFLNVSDGFKIGDTLQDYIVAVLTDGGKFGDTLQEYWVIFLTDRAKMGDSPVAIARMRPGVTDGVKLSDSIDGKQTLYPDLTDGITLSDSPDVNCIFYCELEDGVTLTDLNQEYFVEQLTDGIKFEDFTLYKKEKSELRIDFSAFPILLEIDCVMSFDDNFKAKAIDKTISPIKEVFESFKINPITMTFKGNPIVFTFKAIPEDYDLD